MSSALNHSISFYSKTDGPRLIILGAVHGNETCGTEAIEHIIAEFSAKNLVLQRGTVTFVPVTNPMAYERRQRCGERNLNRMLMPYENPKVYEDHIANWLCPLLAKHDVLLDLHSFQSQGKAFVMVGPENNDGGIEPFKFAAQEKALAKILGVTRAVDGWLKTYDNGIRRRQAQATSDTPLPEQNIYFGVGTTEYMRTQGGYGVTLECGSHLDPQAPVVARHAILNTLTHLGMIEQTAPLVEHSMESLRLYDVIDKHHDDDIFSQTWSSFDAIKPNEVIGIRHQGQPVLAPEAGYIVFPDEDSRAGDEWFYLARFSERFL